jgi:hypothetical protein
MIQVIRGGGWASGGGMTDSGATAVMGTGLRQRFVVGMNSGIWNGICLLLLILAFEHFGALTLGGVKVLGMIVIYKRVHHRAICTMSDGKWIITVVGDFKEVSLASSDSLTQFKVLFPFFLAVGGRKERGNRGGGVERGRVERVEERRGEVLYKNDTNSLHN